MPYRRLTTSSELYGQGEYIDTLVDHEPVATVRVSDGKVNVDVYDPTQPEDSIAEFQFELPENEEEST